MSELSKQLADRVANIIRKHAPKLEELVRKEFSGDLRKAMDQLAPGQPIPVPDMTKPSAPGSDPIGGGMGSPGGQMDMCPLCHCLDQPGSCTCLAVAKSDPGVTQGGLTDAAATPMMKGALQSGSGDTSGPGAMSGPATSSPQVPMTEGGQDSSALALSEKDPHATKKDNPGDTKDPTKLQPVPPNPRAKLPEKPKLIPSNSGTVEEPKSNAPKMGKPMAKAAQPVPMAKPPSGKVPGQGPAPVASNTSKPMITKADHAMAVQAKQHAMNDASKQAAVAGGPTALAPPLTHPGNPARANHHASAMAGDFQPKGPINSGLDLKSPPASMRRPFGKSDSCALCKGAEHPGVCQK